MVFDRHKNTAGAEHAVADFQVPAVEMAAPAHHSISCPEGCFEEQEPLVWGLPAFGPNSEGLGSR